jgi:hypothetical protein
MTQPTITAKYRTYLIVFNDIRKVGTLLALVIADKEF